MLVLNGELSCKTGSCSEFDTLVIAPESIGEMSTLKVDKANKRLVICKAMGKGSTFGAVERIGISDKAVVTIYFLNNLIFYQLHSGSVVFEHNGAYYEYSADGTYRRKTVVNKDTTFKKVVNEKTRKARMVTVYADVIWQDYESIKKYCRMYVEHSTHQPHDMVEYYLDNCFFTIQMERTAYGFYSKPLRINDTLSVYPYEVLEVEPEIDIGEEVFDSDDSDEYDDDEYDDYDDDDDEEEYD